MILDSFKLSEKVAVVTGANTGLGQGIELARERLYEHIP